MTNHTIDTDGLDSTSVDAKEDAFSTKTPWVNSQENQRPEAASTCRFASKGRGN